MPVCMLKQNLINWQTNKSYKIISIISYFIWYKNNIILPSIFIYLNWFYYCIILCWYLFDEMLEKYKIKIIGCIKFLQRCSFLILYFTSHQIELEASALDVQSTTIYQTMETMWDQCIDWAAANPMHRRNVYANKIKPHKVVFVESYNGYLYILQDFMLYFVLCLSYNSQFKGFCLL